MGVWYDRYLIFSNTLNAQMRICFPQQSQIFIQIYVDVWRYGKRDSRHISLLLFFFRVVLLNDLVQRLLLLQFGEKLE